MNLQELEKMDLAKTLENYFNYNNNGVDKIINDILQNCHRAILPKIFSFCSKFIYKYARLELSNLKAHVYVDGRNGYSFIIARKIYEHTKELLNYNASYAVNKSIDEDRSILRQIEETPEKNIFIYSKELIQFDFISINQELNNLQYLINETKASKKVNKALNKYIQNLKEDLRDLEQNIIKED